MPPEVVDLLARELEIQHQDVYTVSAPLDLGGLFDVCKLDRPDLKYRSWVPVTPRFAHDLGGDGDLFRVLREDQLLVHHPYDSFEHTVEAFIAQAAEDPAVLAIKQTLYRTSGPVSPIIRSLTRAAEAGKQVVAMVELTARFDEQNNINWAEVLEDAGVHVVYGTVGLKTHAKVTLVVREESGGIRRYCHIGTGNYNRDTARVYEDLGLLTSDPALGADVGELFNSLTGYSRQARYRKLLVAPDSMRPAVLRLIRRETERGEAGRIVIKVNNLVDPEMIGALCLASQAGVQIDLIVRSICCLRPGVPGLTENIRVRSLVGRYLEHSRILRFGRDGKDSDYYISSADLMPRNLDRRVEAAVPIRAPELRARLDEVLDINLSDDTLAWELGSDGDWRRASKGPGVDTQLRLQEVALRRAEGKS
jgi:polyphosphate kinase